MGHVCMDDGANLQDCKEGDDEQDEVKCQDDEGKHAVLLDKVAQLVPVLLKNFDPPHEIFAPPVLILQENTTTKA